MPKQVMWNVAATAEALRDHVHTAMIPNRLLVLIENCRHVSFGFELCSD